MEGGHRASPAIGRAGLDTSKKDPPLQSGKCPMDLRREQNRV